MGQEKQYFHLRACFKEQGTLFTLRVLWSCLYLHSKMHLWRQEIWQSPYSWDKYFKIKQTTPKYFDLATFLLSSLLSTHHRGEGQVPNPFQMRGKLSPIVRIQKYLALPKLAPGIFKNRNFCSEQACEVSILQNIKGNQDNFFWLFTLICHKIYMDKQNQ